LELSAGDERDEVGVHLSGVVAADEEPILAADGLAAEFGKRSAGMGPAGRRVAVFSHG
jgi:hypothetical protein